MSKTGEPFVIICCAGSKPCGKVFYHLIDWTEHYAKDHTRRLPDFLQKILDNDSQKRTIK